jgi:predicted kinase
MLPEEVGRMDASTGIPTLYILCGLPFSGKSSLGRALAAHTDSDLVSFDDLFIEHSDELGNSREMFAVWQAVRDLAELRIGALLRLGRSVVYDNTNFRIAHREALRAAAAEAGARAVVIYVNTPLEIIAAHRAANIRARQREDITDADLATVLGMWESPQDAEGAREFRPGMDVAAWLTQLAGSSPE